MDGRRAERILSSLLSRNSRESPGYPSTVGRVEADEAGQEKFSGRFQDEKI